MRQQCSVAARGLLDPLVATLGKRAIPGQHVTKIGFGDVVKLLTGHVRSVERDNFNCHVVCPVWRPRRHILRSQNALAKLLKKIECMLAGALHHAIGIRDPHLMVNLGDDFCE